MPYRSMVTKAQMYKYNAKKSQKFGGEFSSTWLEGQGEKSGSSMKT